MKENKIVLETEYFRLTLKRQLDEMSCSQKQLAKYLGISENTISSWLSDNQKAQPHGLRLILSILEFLMNNNKDFNPIRLFIPSWEDPHVKYLKSIIYQKNSCINELKTDIANYKKQVDDLEREKK